MAVADAPRGVVFRLTPLERETLGERFNVIEGGKRFRCNFIEPGLVSYSDVGGNVELLRKETIDRALQTAIGNPLTMGHVPTRMNGAALAQASCGVIDRAGYDEKTGWFFVEGSITERGRDAIRNNGKRPSCGYRVTQFRHGGSWHNMPYSQEIADISFHHLALVDCPRYEGADFRLNSKPKTAMKNPLKFLWNTDKPAADAGGQPVTEATSAEIAPEATVEIEGKSVRLNELVEAYQGQSRANELQPDSEIEFTGADKVVRKVKLLDLTQNYEDRENGVESPAQKTAREAAERKSANEAAAAKAAEERQNGKNSFRVLSSARSTPVARPIERFNSADTTADKVARGAERYGSGKN